MAKYITTCSGIHFYPTEPSENDINIYDIAHSLSMQCRANGHYKKFFSVAAHCIVCAEEAEACEMSKRVCLACLLHDASEAYIADVPSPVKAQLDIYNKIEDRLLDAVFNKFLGGITEEENNIVKLIDKRTLYHEFYALMGEKLEYCGDLKSTPDFSFSPPKETEQKYIELFMKLTDEK